MKLNKTAGAALSPTLSTNRLPPTYHKLKNGRHTYSERMLNVVIVSMADIKLTGFQIYDFRLIEKNSEFGRVSKRERERVSKYEYLIVIQNRAR